MVEGWGFSVDGRTPALCIFCPWTLDPRLSTLLALTRPQSSSVNARRFAFPMMQQYHEAKQAAGDALLLFRMGDFYELFFDDAKIAARTLGIALTSRDKGDDPVPMAGFPYHQLDAYLAKIIAAGHRAAICEQVEDPEQAKGIVKREVTRIVTPGTLTDDALLDPRASNYLAAIAVPATGSTTSQWPAWPGSKFRPAVSTRPRFPRSACRPARPH